jgi:hypothetical protein
MIVDTNYRMSTPSSSKTGLILVERKRFSILEEQSTNEYASTRIGGQSDLVIETSNMANLPSASDLEAQELEEDLLVAQKSHLEYLSGTGRPFEEFLVELRREEGMGEVSG